MFAVNVTAVIPATPSNIGCRLLESGRVEGVSGVNLPTLRKVDARFAARIAGIFRQVLAG